MNGQVIIVAGSSGAGKTTTINTFANRAQAPYLIFGMDIFLGAVTPGKFSLFGDRTREGMYQFPIDADDPDGQLRFGFGEFGWASIEAFHEMIATASRMGMNVLVDHLMFVDPPMLQDCVWRLQDVPVLLVGLKPPYEILNTRRATRNMDISDQMRDIHGDSAQETINKNMENLDRWFYQSSYVNDCYDLLLDSTQLNPDEVCEKIEQRLETGPGTAFETLRKRYPKSQ